MQIIAKQTSTIQSKWRQTKQLATLLIAFLLLNLTSELDALKVSIQVPELVKLNDAFWLNCSYELLMGEFELKTTRDNNNNNNLSLRERYREIYSIKWYKDNEEFYRFVPTEEPPVRFYETSGVQLSQTKSHEGNVFLTKADVNTEGDYRCDILAETSFETVRKSKHLKVYALPVRGPRIEILDSSGRPKVPNSLKSQEVAYAIGDKIELRCNSAPSKPAAKLRWFVNDQELIVPMATNNSGFLETTTNNQRSKRAASPNNQQQTYNAKVSPVEYNQHYKGIYSSRSTLSLILQDGDLINNKISFKCLVSMRRDVPVRSKQLILLTRRIPPRSRPSRATSTSTLDPDSTVLVSDSADNEQQQQQQQQHQLHHRQAQRAQSQRHSISRLQPPSSSSASRSQQQKMGASRISADLINNLPDGDLQNQMVYVYEEADTSLGVSITDSFESLERYARRNLNESSGFNSASGFSSIANSNNNNYRSEIMPLEFNRADNLEYVQLMRDRQARQRSFPGSSSSSSSNSNGGKRHYNANSLIKSPLELDENDPLRPIISWPPLDSGKLLLLPPGNTIVAIPTQSMSNNNNNNNDKRNLGQRFILPGKEMDSQGLFSASSAFRFGQQQPDEMNSGSMENEKRLIMLDKLLQNLNCTSTEGNIDTKLEWVINDSLLSSRDTYYYPSRVSSDHKQVWFTIGLKLQNQPTAMISSQSQSQATTLKSNQNGVLLNSILNPYFKNPESFVRLYSSTSEQIRFVCQAVHSMLLYSSSETITFDFNPPPIQAINGNSIDNLSPMPSNVIQATSASQSSSAQANFVPTRSQLTVFLCIVLAPLFFVETLRKVSNLKTPTSVR